jgi:hypothetical protein
METMTLGSPAAEISSEIEVAPANLAAESAPQSAPEAASKGVGAICVGACATCPANCFFAGLMQSESGTEPPSNNAVQTPNDPSQPGGIAESGGAAEPNNFVTGKNFGDDPDMAPTGAGQLPFKKFLDASKKPAQTEDKVKVKPVLKPEFKSKPKPESKPKPVESKGKGETRKPIVGIQETITVPKTKTEEAKPRTEPKPKSETAPEPEPTPEISTVAAKTEAKPGLPDKSKSEKTPPATGIVVNSTKSNKPMIETPTSTKKQTPPKEDITAADPPKPKIDAKIVSAKIDKADIPPAAAPKAVIQPKTEKPQEKPPTIDKLEPPKPVEKPSVQNNDVKNTTIKLNRQVIPEKEPEKTKNSPEIPPVLEESPPADDNKPPVVVGPTKRKVAINLPLNIAGDAKNSPVSVSLPLEQDRPKTIRPKPIKETRITPITPDDGKANTATRDIEPETPVKQPPREHYDTIIDEPEKPLELLTINYDAELNAQLEMIEITAPTIETVDAADYEISQPALTADLLEIAKTDTESIEIESPVESYTLETTVEIADKINFVDEVDFVEEEILIEQDMITVYDRSMAPEECIITIRRNAAPADADDELLAAITIEEDAIIATKGTGSKAVARAANSYRRLIIAFLGRKVAKSLHRGAVAA